ncbi:hypothetical protein MMC30_000323 [Trapelia coarctata]|nr:hypothetical protein [Trapelia coarctata]
MPQSPDYSIDDEQPPEDSPPYYQEEPSRRKAVPPRTSNKSRRKYEAAGEQTNKEKAAKTVSRDVTESTSHFPISQTVSPSFPQQAYGTTSPVLTALGGISAFNSTATDIGAWANTVPFSRSLPQGYNDGVSLSGSPPGVSSPSGEVVRGGFSTTSPPTSPRAAYRVPVRPSNGYQSFGDYLGSSPGPGSSTSMPVEFAMAPPLPHQHQPHYFGVRDANLGFSSQRHALRRSGAGAFNTFDTLASSGDGSTSTTENVLLVAVERGLAIYGVEKNRINILGRLEGFRGEVVGAKILQCHSNADALRSSRPLISVIIHGPITMAEETRPETSHSGDIHDPSAETTAMNSNNPTMTISTHQYQTTVEVYSLKDQKHITTLFKSPVVEGEPLFRGMIVEPPPPVGNLTLSAKGRFLILSSGISGEVYIFEVLREASGTSSEAFRCIGKSWTSVPARKPRSYSSSSACSEVEGVQEGSPNRKAHLDAPVVSLSHRWLVIAPPPSSSRSTLQGTLNTRTLGKKTSGLKSHGPPSQPPVSCEVDPPDSESLFNRVARNVAQEVIKGGSYVVQQGIQKWNNYFQQKSGSSPPLDYGMQSPANQPMFPPTHANDDRIRINNQPALISILDLERLSATSGTKGDPALQPIATFALPGGCSFVSLNPTGLSLLTASGKGDVQHVWDLMRMVYGKTNAVAINEKTTAEEKPTVRQIALFTRVTEASIVDVVWTEPKGERLVIVTDKGTVHIHDLPASAFQWPPPRRVARPTSGNTENTKTVNTSSGAFSAAVNIMSGTIRGRQSNITSAITGIANMNLTAGAAAGAGVKGGKLVAAGVGTAVGAAAGLGNSLMHRGENRLHVSGTIARGCVRCLSGQDRNLLAVVGGGLVQVHDVHQSTMVKSGMRRPSVVGGKLNEFRIASSASPSANTFNPLSTTSDPTTSVVGSWPQPPSKPSKVKLPSTEAAKPGTGSPKVKGQSHIDSPNLKRQPSTESPKVKGKSSSKHKAQPSIDAPKTQAHPIHAVHPLSFAEIETNAPYQPFHTDHRINLYVYDKPCDGTDLHHLTDFTPWIPQDIPCTLVSSGAAIAAASQYASAMLDDGPVGMENVVRLEDDAEGGRQLVVTTRRRKGKKGEDGEEGIFDDADLVEFVDERV